jgi:D-3-phosphoglycerate dehydrogenase
LDLGGIMEKFDVYLADIHGNSIDIEREILKDIAKVEHGERLKDEKEESERVLKHSKDADAIGVRHTRITKQIIKELNKCRIIARFGGGFDNIDIKEASKRGIIVTFVPDYCTEAVAEHALTFALIKIREIKEFERRIEEGFWSAQNVSTEMAKDVTLGIIGLGRIGGTLSKKANCVGFNVVAYDPFISEEEFKAKKAKKMQTLEDLLKVSDIISLSVPLTNKEESKHPTFRMLNKKAFKKIKDRAYIINVCRGEIIDKEALITSLESGKISGVALDVVEGEPIQGSYLKKGDNPYFDKFKSLPNVTITPHCGFTSTRSVRTVKEKGAMEIKRVLEGGFPRNIAWVNPEVKEKYLEKIS